MVSPGVARSDGAIAQHGEGVQSDKGGSQTGRCRGGHANSENFDLRPTSGTGFERPAPIVVSVSYGRFVSGDNNHHLHLGLQRRFYLMVSFTRLSKNKALKLMHISRGSFIFW